MECSSLKLKHTALSQENYFLFVRFIRRDSFCILFLFLALLLAFFGEEENPSFSIENSVLFISKQYQVFISEGASSIKE